MQGHLIRRVHHAILIGNEVHLMHLNDSFFSPRQANREKSLARGDETNWPHLVTMRITNLHNFFKFHPSVWPFTAVQDTAGRYWALTRVPEDFAWVPFWIFKFLRWCVSQFSGAVGFDGRFIVIGGSSTDEVTLKVESVTQILATHGLKLSLVKSN